MRYLESLLCLPSALTDELFVFLQDWRNSAEPAECLTVQPQFRGGHCAIVSKNTHPTYNTRQ